MASLLSVTCAVINKLIERDDIFATILDNRLQVIREIEIKSGCIETISLIADQKLMITNKTHPMSGGIQISTKDLENKSIVVSDTKGDYGINGGNPRQLFYSLFEMNNK